MQGPCLYLHNYTFPGEGPEETLLLAKEVLALDLQSADVQCPEQRPDAGRSQHSNVSGESPAQEALTEIGEGRPPVPFGLRTGQQALVIATIICILSCLMSYYTATL